MNTHFATYHFHSLVDKLYSLKHTEIVGRLMLQAYTKEK